MEPSAQQQVIEAAPSAAFHGTPLLVANQSRAYRLARSIMLAGGGVLAGSIAVAAALLMLALLPLVLPGPLLVAAQTITVLAGMVTALIGFSAIFVSFAELGRKPSIEVFGTSLIFNDLDDPTGADAKFAEREIELAAVREVGVSQGRFAKLLGYGAIEIFTGGSEPAAALPGLARPHAFKEKLDRILQAQ